MKKPPWHSLYKKADWLRLAEAHRLKEPLCRNCARRGFLNDGTRRSNGAPQRFKRLRTLQVDHIIPHKGDLALFYDPENLQSLCADCHARDKQREERKGFSEERGLDGWPLDPSHPANRA
ncbi:MAG: HNH endonuclease [Pseudomonadota bacterium]